MKVIDLLDKQQAIREAVSVLRSGGLVIFPTETAYGAGALASSTEGVSKLLKFKRRPAGKAISVAVADRATAERYVTINPEAGRIYKEFLPGPVTVISESRGVVDKRLESEKGTLGIRIPGYEFTLDLLRELGEGITATSANPAGRKTPYSLEDIKAECSMKQLGLVDLMLNAGELPHNPTSTVIDTTTTGLQVLRQGHIRFNKLVMEKVVKTDTEMQRLGEQVFKLYQNRSSACLLFLLDGELGAGKTQFVKGMASAAGVSDTVSSPTYTIINEYETARGLFVHMDAWRLEGSREIRELRLEQYIRKGNVIALEWSAGAIAELNKFIHSQKVTTIECFFDYVDQNTRLVKIYAPETIGTKP
jgi:L-threonylcarbamoyladenylate synthase